MKGPVVGLAGLTLLTALLARPQPSAAADFSVQSETVWQAYRIRGRDGLFSIPRSRITQWLFLSGTDLLGLADDPSKPAHLGLNLNLGLDHDFGVQDAAMDPGDPASFIPLLTRTQVGMFSGHLSGSFGLDPMFGFSLGRLVLLDAAGFMAIDGLEVELRFARIVNLELAMGFELVQDVRLTLVDFSPEGVAWGDRRGAPEELHREVTEVRLRPVLVAGLSLDIPWGGSVSLAYHATWADPGFEHMAMERLGIGLELSGHGRPISVSLRSAYDLIWSRMAELDANVEIRPRPMVGFGVTFVHMLPLFDTASIFNVFDVDPHDEVGCFVHLGRPGRSMLALSAGAALRLTEPGEGADGDERYSDVSGWLLLRLGVERFGLIWTARGSGGESGVLAGTTARASLGLLDGRLTPGMGVGLWYWDDPLRRSHHGLTAGGSASMSFSPVQSVTLLSTLDVFHNRVSGTGLSLTLRLVVRL